MNTFGQLNNVNIREISVLPSPEDIRLQHQLSIEGGARVVRSRREVMDIFDGKSGNFLAFPGSVISQRCGFALTMDIMPRELEREQMIFRQYGPAYQTGFCIINRNGKVVVTFRYRDPCKEESGEKIFDPELKLKADTYQQLRMSYDGRNLTIAVDDAQKVIPCTGIPYWSTPSNFGGDISKNGKGQPSFFNGRLKSFKVERL